MEGTAEVPDPSAAAHLPEAASVCDAATALDTARDMADLQPTRVELLVSHVRLPREFLPRIGINSIDLLLQQPRLFKTDLFENALGPRARANLTREKQALLDRLRGLEHDVGHPRR